MTGPLPPEERLARALAELRILVVCGSGGVGKTTTAAALGLAAALEGRRVLVCTVDPSRRLATSLGLQSLSGRPRKLDLTRHPPAPGGALYAMTLDTKHTFDALVERHARDDSARQRILQNRFYREISDALAGSHEYMAMEKLLELSEDERFDLVVLDTPPTRHALDFLEAPDRLLSFLDTSVLRYFLRPYFAAGRITLKIATRTGALALKMADRFLGLQFLEDLSEFFLAFESLYDGFKERAGKVYALLRDARSGFVLVAAPSGAALQEALYFHERLLEKAMPFLVFVVNRVHRSSASLRRGRAGQTPELAADFKRRLRAVHEDYEALARAELRAVGRLEVDAGEAPILVPELETDVHDLAGLRQVAKALLRE
jgi:anion-transporting  ArsA/GET3 family ATPase